MFKAEEEVAENSSPYVLQYMFIKNPRGFESFVPEGEKEKKNTKESDNTGIKMADVQYNIYCMSIHQIKTNVLTSKMFSLYSNKSLLPERSKTIFIFPSLQGKLCYQHQILLIQLLHREI